MVGKWNKKFHKVFGFLLRHNTVLKYLNYNEFICVFNFFLCSIFLPFCAKTNSMATEQRDEQLWRIAKKRAGFRKHLYTYIIIVCFLWGIWWFTIGRDEGFSGYPWPIWVMLGWGIGLAFNYFDAYHGSHEEMTQQEYEKLKRERGIQ